MKRRITKDIVRRALTSVIDPELHVDIVSLGLIYDVIINDKLVEIVMTLTTPGCPLAPQIEELTREALKPLGVKEIKVTLVWEPPWTVERMGEEAKLKLGIV